MNDHLRIRYSARLAFILFVALMAGSVSQVYAGDSKAEIIPAHARPYGMTYGEWSARLWHWVYSLSGEQHPLFDTADCSEGQEGNVWFLGGTFTTVEDGDTVLGTADRHCKIPLGTALFFPIMNAECNEIIDEVGNEEVLRECANSLADHLQELKVTIDGKEVDHYGLYRADSPFFTIGPLPEDNIVDAAPGVTAPSVGDGYFIMLAPLSIGRHTIHFEGVAVFTVDEDGFDFRFKQDINYTIHVVP